MSADDLTPEKAVRALEMLEPWVDGMREVYKERLASEFESPTPRREVVEQIGARLAVMNDLQSDMHGLVNDARINDQYRDETA